MVSRMLCSRGPPRACGRRTFSTLMTRRAATTPAEHAHRPRNGHRPPGTSPAVDACGRPSASAASDPPPIRSPSAMNAVLATTGSPHTQRGGAPGARRPCSWSNTAQSLRWPSGIVSPTERDDHPYPANGHHAHNRLALFVTKRHQRSRECGWRAVTYSSPDRLGLIKPRFCQRQHRRPPRRAVAGAECAPAGRSPQRSPWSRACTRGRPRCKTFR